MMDVGCHPRHASHDPQDDQQYAGPTAHGRDDQGGRDRERRVV